MIDKVQHFTKYYDDIGYLASGVSIDYAYGMLGAAGVAFEIGDDFYQDCDSFESDILQDNLKALNYLAKISKFPYSFAKGPDIIKLSVRLRGNSLNVSATASDKAYSYNQVATSKQSVQEIRVFINHHPDSGASTGTVMKKGLAVIDVTLLARRGRNNVYVQATDSNGYQGPVQAGYFTKN